jgi:hypothetical protein
LIGPAEESVCSLAGFRVAAMGFAPKAFAIWMAARPTLLAAAVISN